MHGQGQATGADGNRFIGTYVNGKREGRGKEIYKKQKSLDKSRLLSKKLFENNYSLITLIECTVSSTVTLTM